MVISADPRNTSRVAGVEYGLSDQEKMALDDVLNKMSEKKLTKSASNSFKRLLFVAGLEGSGHHMIGAMMKKCTLCSYDPEIPRLLFDFVNCSLVRPPKPDSPKIPNGLYHRADSYVTHCQKERSKDTYNGLYGADSYITHGSSVIEVYKRMKKMASSSSDGLILVNSNRDDDHVGQLSYPNFEGPLRNLHNPDLHVLAAIAEAAGIDFRVLVLQRSADEMYKSFQRRFHSHSGRTLMSITNSAATLFTQLHRIDSSFYMCAPYNEMKSFRGDAGRKLIDFLLPDLYFRDGGRGWEAMMDQIHVKKNESTGSNDQGAKMTVDSDRSGSAMRYHLRRLESRVDMLADLCAHGVNQVK
jgi:hypothetical protein